MAIGARIVNDSGGKSQTYTTKTGASLDGSRKADAKTSYQVSSSSGFTPTVTIPTTTSAAPISSGGGSSSSASSSGGGGGGFDYLAQLRSLAEDAYNRSMNALKATRTTTLGKLLESYNASKDALQNQFNASKQNLTDDNEQALREAYIRKMLDARDMAQLLTAQGLTGGASETTTANMLNNYANNRNALNRDFARNLLSLSTNHESSLADILGKYNDKVAQAEQAYASNAAQLENNRMNMLASVLTRFGDLAGIVF